MESVGLCTICGAPTTRTCAMCGRAYCSEHMRGMVCVHCSGKRRVDEPTFGGPSKERRPPGYM